MRRCPACRGARPSCPADGTQDCPRVTPSGPVGFRSGDITDSLPPGFYSASMLSAGTGSAPEAPQAT